jgi:tRNA-dihydrouridine synthase
VETIVKAKEFLKEKKAFGVMIGRAAYNNIFEMRKID